MDKLLASNACSDVVLRVCDDQSSRCKTCTYLFGRIYSDRVEESLKHSPWTISTIASALLLASTLTLFYTQPILVTGVAFSAVVFSAVALLASLTGLCLRSTLVAMFALRYFYHTTPMQQKYEQKFIDVLRELCGQNQFEKAYRALNEILEYLDNQPGYENVKHRLYSYFIFECICVEPDNIDLLHRLIIDYVSSDQEADGWYQELAIRQAKTELDKSAQAISLINNESTRHCLLKNLSQRVGYYYSEPRRRGLEGHNERVMIYCRDVIRNDRAQLSHNIVVGVSQSVLKHLDHEMSELRSYARPFIRSAHARLGQALPDGETPLKTLLSHFGYEGPLGYDHDIVDVSEQLQFQNKMQNIQAIYRARMREIRMLCHDMRSELLQNRSRPLCMRVNQPQIINVLREIDRKRAVAART